MKVLVVPSWYPPNGGRFFKLQAESLAKLGHEVEVLVLEEKGITQKVNKKIDASKSKWVNEYRHSFYRIPKLNTLNIHLFIRKFKRILRAYLKENKVDVIHIHSAIWAGVAVVEVVKDFNLPFVITEHRSLFFEEKWDYSDKLKTRMKNAFKNAKSIIVVSSSMKKALTKFTRNKIEIIPNMIDTDFFSLKSKSESKQITFISVGNLISVKGYDLLLEAFARLYHFNKFIQLKIIGEGKNKLELEVLAKKLEIDGVVSFCGYKTKNELLEAYHSADVFVSSSRKESFGVVIIEAMSCGLPVVVSKSGGPEDIVNEKNGYLAENENANSLQAKMQMMIENMSNFESEIIRQNIIAKYSEKVVSEKLEKELKKCLNNKNQLK